MERTALTAIAIENVSEEIENFLAEKGINQKMRLRIRLAAEELLLKYRDEFGEKAKIEVLCERKFTKARVAIRVYSQRLNPFDDISDEDKVLHRITYGMDFEPSWVYRNGINTITFRPSIPGKDHSLIYVIGALVLGVCLGLAAQLLPRGVYDTISESYFTPVFSTYMSFLSTVAALLVFLSVASGICGMGDLATFNKMGKRMLLRFLFQTFIIGALTILASLLLFNIEKSDAGAMEVSTLWSMLVDIVPTNIIEAFRTGNTLQIIFLAICLSIAILVLEAKGQGLVDFISEANNAVRIVMSTIVKLMPVMVFISVFKLAASGDILQVIKVYKFVLYTAIIGVITLVFFVLRTALTQKVKLSVMLKKIMPAFTMAFITASGMATFPVMLNDSRFKLGIDGRLAKVGVPLGITTFRPLVSVSMIIGVMCMAETFNVQLTTSMLLPLLLSATVFALSAPPVPGAMVACYTLIFAQTGIPSEAIAIIVAVDVIMDRMNTCHVIGSVYTEMTQLASSMNMLDKEKLRA